MASTKTARRDRGATRRHQGQAGQEEGQEERRDGHRPHPVDVQQHRRHDHRRQRQHRRVVERRLARLQGLAQVDAVRRAARRRRGRAQGDGARHALRRRLREGPRRRPRERAPRAPDGGLQGHAHPRRHARPAQRLPSAEAPPRLTRSDSTKRKRVRAQVRARFCFVRRSDPKDRAWSRFYEACELACCSSVSRAAEKHRTLGHHRRHHTSSRRRTTRARGSISTR